MQSTTFLKKYSPAQWIVICIATIVVIVAGCLAFTFWYNSTHLVLTKTRPDKKMAASATDVVFWYNRPISPETAKNFSISPKVPGKIIVDGNALTFSPTDPLDERTYTASISSSTSSDGKYTMGMTKLTFDIGYVPSDEQPKEVQDRARALTDNEPPKLVFFGSDELINQGVTTEQLTGMEDYMGGLFEKSSKVDYIVNIDSVVTAPYDSNSTNPKQTYTFNMEMNDVTYKARLDCLISGSARLSLYNAAGKLVKQSGKLGSDDS